VFIGGCWLGECRFITQGNYDALSLVHLSRKILAHIGVSPERLRIEWISASEGVRFAEIMNDFSKTLKRLGPLGAGEGLSKQNLAFKLETVTHLLPYIRLVERERLRVKFDTEKEYDEFFNSEAVGRIFQQSIVDKLAMTQLMVLLREKPCSINELAERLGVAAPAVTRHLTDLARQGLVRFDDDQDLVAAA
jgi:NADH-quinone oxidoreductase subunit E